MIFVNISLIYGKNYKYDIITVSIMDNEKKKYSQNDIILGLDIGTEFVKAVIAV